jgi:UDP-glucuronate 4-epimerase
LYGATKKANELMAHTYWHLFGVKSAGLRFFTVYGPYVDALIARFGVPVDVYVHVRRWGRPDMAIYMFTKKILAGEPIDVFNNGDMMRDFTYIDDIVAVSGPLA